MRISGPAVELSPSGVQTFALIVHELCTNAAKYGALSNASGEVLAEWSLGGNGADGYMDFSWKERGGPPVEPASHEGFGLSLITAMGSNPASEPVIDFAPSGFACRIRVPLDTISTEPLRQGVAHAGATRTAGGVRHERLTPHRASPLEPSSPRRGLTLGFCRSRLNGARQRRQTREKITCAALPAWSLASSARLRARGAPTCPTKNAALRRTAFSPPRPAAKVGAALRRKREASRRTAL